MQVIVIQQNHYGWLEVIYGCMRSGKSAFLVEQLYEAQKNYRVVAFKPLTGSRDQIDFITSRSGAKFRCTRVAQAESVFEQSMEAHVVGIDEVHFFGADLVAVCLQLVRMGKRVITSGLELDSENGQPLAPIATLLPYALVPHRRTTRCIVCGQPATHTKRTEEAPAKLLQPGAAPEDLVGDEGYEPVCMSHFVPLAELSKK